MFEALVKIDLSSCVVMELQQVLQRGWNWIYLLTLVSTTVWHRERRGSDYDVYYCKLADSHGCFFTVDPLTGCCDGCFSSVCVHFPNEIVTQVTLSWRRHSLLETSCRVHSLFYGSVLTSVFIDSLLFVMVCVANYEQIHILWNSSQKGGFLGMFSYLFWLRI